MIDLHHGWNASFKPSIIGFVASFALMVAAYRIVMHGHLTGETLLCTIIGLGALQVFLQLIFFFHLGLESKPHWNTITLLFTILVVLIIFGGTLWIMNHLDYNLMPKMEH